MAVDCYSKLFAIFCGLLASHWPGIEDDDANGHEYVDDNDTDDDADDDGDDHDDDDNDALTCQPVQIS